MSTTRHDLFARLVCFASLAALCSARDLAQAQASDPQPRLTELGFSIPMTPRGSRPVHRVLLPQAVYQHIKRADLGDIRVFNDEGEQLPHTIRVLDGSGDQLAQSGVALPFFPLRADEGRLPSLGHLSVAVDGDGARARVDLAALLQAAAPDAGTLLGADAGAPQPARVGAYIVDASALPRPLTALRIETRSAGQDFVLPVGVERSDDLSSFERVRTSSALVQLEYAGARIERDRIELPPTDAPYLRLLPARVSGQGAGLSPWPVQIDAVYAELEPEQVVAVRHHVRVRGTPRPGEAGVYDFDLGGFVPVDRVRVLLPADNMLIEASVHASGTPRSAGTRMTDGLFYRLQRGGTPIESPPIELERRREERYWSLRVTQKGGGLGAGVPELELSRHPDQLLFVARGPAPYHLAFGHHAAGPAGFEPRQILALLTEDARADASEDVSLGALQTRAGRAALEAPPPPPPYKRYLLWAVLVAGALLLMRSALRMLREAK